MAAYPTWPAILTNADWQKKKGTLSKAIGKTGVGEAMTAAQAAFAKIDFSKMDATSIMPADRDIPIILARQKEAKAYYAATVAPVREKVKKIAAAAEETAKKFKASKLIPASSGQHAAAVDKAADLMWMTLKDNSSLFDDLNKSFDAMVAVKQKGAAEEAKKLSTTIANLETALKKAVANPTSLFWRDGSDSPHQRCRSMCNAIRNIPELKAKYWSIWQKFGDEYHKDVKDGAPNEKDAMKVKIGTVIKALSVFKASYQTDMGAK